jgi:hypothetical protein
MCVRVGVGVGGLVEIFQKWYSLEYTLENSGLEVLELEKKLRFVAFWTDDLRLTEQTLLTGKIWNYSNFEVPNYTYSNEMGCFFKINNLYWSIICILQNALGIWSFNHSKHSIMSSPNQTRFLIRNNLFSVMLT